MFAIRAVLASTFSPAWGVYSGYELFEHRAVRVAFVHVAAVDEVVADAAQLEAAVLNLLLNAAEATPVNGLVRVSVEPASGGDASTPSHLRVCIRDGGTGVAIGSPRVRSISARTCSH